MNKEEKIIIEELKSQEIKEDFIIKIIVIGDSGVGKTNLIKRFISNTFNENTKATVGVEFICKKFKINRHVFKIDMWDTAGQERYKSITGVYYKGAKGALIVYDVTSKTSFDNIEKWITEIKEKTSDDIKLIIIGNKMDLKKYREITYERALDKAKIIGIPLMETSAMNATNVKEAFYDLLKEIYRDMKDQLKDTENNNNNFKKEGIQLDTSNEKEKSGCC